MVVLSDDCEPDAWGAPVSATTVGYSGGFRGMPGAAHSYKHLAHVRARESRFECFGQVDHAEAPLGADA